MFIKLTEWYPNGALPILVNVEQITYVEKLAHPEEGGTQTMIWFQALDSETRDGVGVLEPYKEVCDAILFTQRRNK